ncbi:MAG: hypothetical protein K1X66_05045 [Verrucomicrobiae bacterium]|nr:hypothetical protein [Verrucomicrobiae bacterium]
MRILRFVCETPIKMGVETIFEKIQNLENWTSFKGYGPLPGIRKTEYAVKTNGITGSVVQVENTDGSRHTESFLEWIPEQKIVIKLSDFSSPLSKLSTHFIETWSFLSSGDSRLMRREFELYPKHFMALPFLWIIAQLMKKAVNRHSAFIASQTSI